MKQSHLFTKTRKEAPKDEVSKNAQLLIRAGYIHKHMAGVYEYLPLGLRVLNNIMNIIRQEMNAIGGQEMLLSTLQDPSIWDTTGRWHDDAIDVWFKTTLKNGSDVGLANTHEESITSLLTEYVSSYKDLPRYIYQFQTKFRNEVRAKSGIMRTREFIMKDLYSFSDSEESFREFYEKCAHAYGEIFNRVGIGDRTYRTFASGGSFTKYSDEFQTLSDVGEDTIYIHKKRGIAVNKEVYTNEVLKDLGMSKNELTEERAIEVGNIFPLGTRFSDSLGLSFKDEKGEEGKVVMGSYGIGPGRLMGTIVEVLSDKKGIIWPKEVAPFLIHLVEISGGDNEVKKYADSLYEKLLKANIEVLYDDRDVRAGEKFADSDLIGIPTRIVISRKTVDAEKIEKVDRKTGTVELVSESELFV